MPLSSLDAFVRCFAFALITVFLFSLPALAEGVSPLEIIMDGREAAESSNLTEAGMSDLAQSAANVVMYVCGALAIVLVALGLFDLYRAQETGAYGNTPTKSAALWKIVIGGIVTIPAVIAAVLPYLLLG